MTKLSTLIFSLFIVTFSFGKPVSFDKASQVANNYFALYSGKSSQSIANSFSKSYNGITTYYVFNYTGGGFVVVSACDAAVPVLAQSNEGSVENEITNPATRMMFDYYSEEIAYLITSNADNPEALTEWNNILNNNMDYSAMDVTPLLTTTWDQGTWYNYYCPVAAGGPGGKAYAGCVATAMGQVMKFWNFPATGVSSHSYDPGDFPIQSADFGSTNYNFPAMGNKATSSSYQEIATLLYHAGVAVDMDFAADGSGAQSEDVPWAMGTYFNYDFRTIRYDPKSKYSSTTDWNNMLRTELDAGRPLYYSGSSSTVGHAWVCEGYKTAGNMFYMNWGWGSVSNGYFVTTSMNAGGNTFNTNFGVVRGIKPANPNLIVRFVNLNENNNISYGPLYDINCQVFKGNPSSLKLYIDGQLKHTTTLTNFTYHWNTGSAGLGTHKFRVEAISGTDTSYHEVNMGLSEWVTQNSGFTSKYRYPSYIHVLNPNIVWATASDGSGGGATTNEFTRTVNGGATWVPGKVLGGSVYGLGNVCGLNANTAFVALFSGGPTQDNTCGVYKTIDGGATWTQLPGALQGSASFADNVWFWDENIGMCHGDVKDNYFEIYTTVNGGATWTRVPKADIGGGVNALSGEGGWTSVIEIVGANTVMFGTNKGNLYISHDRGLHWTISKTGISPITDGIQHISFKDEMNGLVSQVKTTVVLKETHDGGATWHTIVPVGKHLTGGMDYVPGTENTYVSIGNTSGGSGVSYSFDGGHSWSMAAGTETEEFISCAFLNNQCGWAGGFSSNATSGGMFKYSGILVPALSPVTNLQAQTVNRTVNLSWTSPVTPALSYKIYRNDTLLVNVTANTYSDPNVATGPQDYCVEAVYAGGSAAKICVMAWIAVGVKPTDEAAYRVYPNPVKSILNIVSPTRFNEVRLVNTMGKVVYTNTNKGTNLRILTEGFDTGMYILQIYSGNQVVSKKILISH